MAGFQYGHQSFPRYSLWVLPVAAIAMMEIGTIGRVAIPDDYDASILVEKLEGWKVRVTGVTPSNITRLEVLEGPLDGDSIWVLRGYLLLQPM